MTNVSISRGQSNYDEASMHQSMLFSDSLKDLKNLRAQLYSAAEYFELSYTNDNEKQIVVETLKDYAIKAFVNTVDHLGSVTYKVNDLLDEKVDEVSGTEFRVSCIEQKLRTCKSYMEREGINQQSSLIETPKHHKRYILPVGETMHNVRRSEYGYRNEKDGWHSFRNSVRATLKETTATSVSKSASSSPLIPQRSATFSFASSTPRKDLGKQDRFPLLRTVSVANRTSTTMSTSPTSRSITPTPNGARRYPSEPRKSVSMRLPAEKNSSKDLERQPSKSKRILKALLSRRQSKKDDMLYTYLDEY